MSAVLWVAIFDSPLTLCEMSLAYLAVAYHVPVTDVVCSVQTMGEDWWLQKLRKYKNVRQKLKGTKMNADEAAEREMQRVKVCNATKCQYPNCDCIVLYGFLYEYYSLINTIVKPKHKASYMCRMMRIAWRE